MKQKFMAGDIIEWDVEIKKVAKTKEVNTNNKTPNKSLKNIKILKDS